MKRYTIGLLLLLLACSARATVVTVVPAPVLWLQFDEGEGNIAIDGSGSGHHATLHGDPEWVKGYWGRMDGRDEWRELLLLPRKGGAVRFGAGRWATVPHDDRLNVGAKMTVACWVRVEGDVGRDNVQVAVEKGDGWGPGSYSLMPVFDHDARFRIAGHDEIGGGDRLFGTGWRHIAATYDGVVTTLYVDGEREDEGKAPDAVGANDGPLYIGSRGGQGHWLQGALDELHLFDEALHHVQVWELSTLGFLSVGTTPNGKLATQWQRLKAAW